MDVSFIVGYTSGNFSSAIVYEKFGFNGTFGISLGLLCINFAYMYFFIEESRSVEYSDCQILFQIHVKEIA